MVRAVRGILIECDPDAREILLLLNARDKFIIEDLDSTHLFINSTHLDRIQYELDKELEKNAYEVEKPV
ncbi:TFIIH subunit TTDA/Tfb5 [Kickxella alabastrina]|uniref:TFIIH subunit TTDA/Tfb5 n=1 Tax=Kickxella alabastrina TaxID=61397 RepID=UPI00221F12D9|nr:TFIIH subunit TTDA/Tfb5 [Kickxella alabastrina]KAI7829993.1 TFIIH subunit TTDA/Tfb5 [Kickxella alabastrina]